MILSKLKYAVLTIVASIFFVACQSGTTNDTSIETANSTPQVGDHVPNNLVCMVNNAYMGMPQLEVEYEGRTYYGCCDMCQERIPKEKEARIAIDPYSLKDVDKSEAYIVLVGDQGQVAYFENKKNYQELIAKSNLAKQRNQQNQQQK